MKQDIVVITTGLFPNQSAYITGATSAVGKLLIPALESIELIPLHVRHHTSNPTTLLHLAASSSNIIDANVNFLEKTLTLAKQQGVKNIIFFSSMSIYGEVDALNISETHTISNPNLYGVSKYFGEIYLKNSDMNVLVLRLPAILTRQNQTYIARLYTALEHSEAIELNNHDKIFNNFISVDDIAQFLLAIKEIKKYDILHLASKPEQTLYEVVTYLKKLLHSSSKITKLTTKNRYYNISINKATKEYNFKPSLYKKSLEKWWSLRNER